MSQCQALCGGTTRDIEQLAHATGARTLVEQRFDVTVGTALSMLILSELKRRDVQAYPVPAWLHGLRNEAVLKLAEDASSW